MEYSKFKEAEKLEKRLCFLKKLQPTCIGFSITNINFSVKGRPHITKQMPIENIEIEEELSEILLQTILKYCSKEIEKAQSDFKKILKEQA